MQYATPANSYICEMQTATPHHMRGGEAVAGLPCARVASQAAGPMVEALLALYSWHELCCLPVSILGVYALDVGLGAFVCVSLVVQVYK